MKLVLSDAVTKMVLKPIQKTVHEDTMKAKLDKIRRPGNCEGLVIPKLNTEIWHLLTSAARVQEVRAEKVQHKTTKAVTKLAQFVN